VDEELVQVVLWDLDDFGAVEVASVDLLDTHRSWNPWAFEDNLGFCGWRGR
jgi:hypothetical protein